MATSFPDAIRDRVYPLLVAAGADLPRGSREGVLRKSWLINGTELDGVSGSFADADNVIEFGLLLRAQGESTNVLNASIVMDDDGARIFCTSEASAHMNFEGPVSAEPTNDDGLFLAWEYFSQFFGTRLPA